MPSVVDQLCCKMQPRRFLSQRAELDMLVLDEGVLTVADQHRADMLAGEVHLDNEGRIHAYLHQRRFEGETLEARIRCTSAKTTTETHLLLDC